MLPLLMLGEVLLKQVCERVAETVLLKVGPGDTGRILLDGEDVTELGITERAKAGISFAFQQPVRFKGLTVRDLITIAARTQIGISEACKSLTAFGICARDYIGREVDSSLSGGELKRIEIATILARGTRLSIFDEPEAGIDLWSFGNLITVFENMHKQFGGSIIIISHQERILGIADKIIVIAGGEVKESASAFFPLCSARPQHARH